MAFVRVQRGLVRWRWTVVAEESGRAAGGRRVRVGERLREVRKVRRRVVKYVSSAREEERRVGVRERRVRVVGVWVAWREGKCFRGMKLFLKEERSASFAKEEKKAVVYRVRGEVGELGDRKVGWKVAVDEGRDFGKAGRQKSVSTTLAISPMAASRVANMASMAVCAFLILAERVERVARWAGSHGSLFFFRLPTVFWSAERSCWRGLRAFKAARYSVSRITVLVTREGERERSEWEAR